MKEFAGRLVGALIGVGAKVARVQLGVVGSGIVTGRVWMALDGGGGVSGLIVDGARIGLAWVGLYLGKRQRPGVLDDPRPDQRARVHDVGIEAMRPQIEPRPEIQVQGLRLQGDPVGVGLHVDAESAPRPVRESDVQVVDGTGAAL